MIDIISILMNRWINKYKQKDPKLAMQNVAQFFCKK